MDSYQCSARGNVQGRGKLKEILSTLISAAYKQWNGKRQSNPLTAF
jgi:hypothetical protein